MFLTDSFPIHAFVLVLFGKESKDSFAETTLVEL